MRLIRNNMRAAITAVISWFLFVLLYVKLHEWIIYMHFKMHVWK